MMNRLFLVTLMILTVAVPVFGMSGYGGDDIAIPPDNYIVEIVDIDGVITRGENVTFDEQTYISARRGSTEVFVPFEKIQSISLSENEAVITGEKKEIAVQITLSDGTTVDTTGMSHYEITGESEYGRFRIRLDHVRKMTLIEKKSLPDQTHPK